MQATQTAASSMEIDVGAVRAELQGLLDQGQHGEVLDAVIRMLEQSSAKFRKLEEERDEYRKLLVHLKEEVERLRRGLVGQKAERLPRNGAQLSLAILAMAMAGSADAGGDAEATATEVEEQLVKQHTRRKPKRKPLPAELPRIEIEMVPPEVERDPEAFKQIGADTREVLE